MIEQFPILLLLMPFLFAVVVSIVGFYNKNLCYPITVLGLSLCVASTIGALIQVIEKGVIHYKLGGWAPPQGIEYVLDQLNAPVLVVISTVALLTAVYSKHSVEIEISKRAPQFYVLFLLLVTGLLGMTITGDAFNLYVLLEISSLSTYGLVALGRGRALLSCFNYIIMGTIGASFYLLGVGYLYIKTGSLNMADIHNILATQGLYGSKSVMVAFILITIGIWIKMAFFPFHSWLPNAYTFAPTATSCLIAPLMTKVSIYIMIRIMYTVFSPAYVFDTLDWANVIVWLAVLSIVAGSIFALSQRDLKKMFSYLIVAEVGYMVGGAWLANKAGLTGAIYHILSDALMTLSLFLTAGIILYKQRDQSFEALSGLYRKMPFTMGCFTVGAFSMIGIPPTCGFFSKWYLISGGIQSGHWEYVVALLFSSLINAILFFRIIEFAYFGTFSEQDDSDHSDHSDHSQVKIDEAPLSMSLPLFCVAIGIIALGIFAGNVIEFINGFVNQAGI